MAAVAGASPVTITVRTPSPFNSLTSAAESLRGGSLVEQYARARELQAEYVFDEITEIADLAVEEANAIGKARLRIDARKWAASKMAPKKYGDKVETKLIGDANNPIAVSDVTAREFVTSRITDLAAKITTESDL
jgi:hypothetical protein